MSNDTTKMCMFSVEETLTMFLRERPYRVVDSKDAIYRELSKHAQESTLFVVENDSWTIGFDTNELGTLPDGMFRVWNRKDWETCDNRNREAVAKANARHEARKAEYLAMKDTVVLSMIRNGVPQNIVDMLIGAYSDEQIKGLYATITATQQGGK